MNKDSCQKWPKTSKYFSRLRIQDSATIGFGFPLKKWWPNFLNCSKCSTRNKWPTLWLDPGHLGLSLSNLSLNFYILSLALNHSLSIAHNLGHSLNLWGRYQYFLSVPRWNIYISNCLWCCIIFQCLTITR